MSQNSPIFILVSPQLGENIGMSMRAMLNFGCRNLRLVSPRAGWSQDAMIQASAGAAEEILPTMQVFDDLSEACHDLHYLLASSARRRDLSLPSYTPQQAVKAMQEKIQAQQKCGILFGCERSGLDNDAVAKANALMEYPCNATFKSLNLAMAVGLFAYEWNPSPSQASKPMPSENQIKNETCLPASLGEIDFLCDNLDAKLAQKDFYRSPDMRPTIKRNIRIMLQKMTPSQQDIRTWHGIIKALCRNNKP